MQIVGGTYDGFFIGPYAANNSYLAAVPTLASATAFTLDQSATNYLFINSAAYNPSGWAVPAIDTSTVQCGVLVLCNETDISQDVTFFSAVGGAPGEFLYGMRYMLSSNYSGATVSVIANIYQSLGLCADFGNALFIIYSAIGYNIATGGCGAGSVAIPALRAIELPPAPSRRRLRALLQRCCILRRRRCGSRRVLRLRLCRRF